MCICISGARGMYKDTCDNIRLDVDQTENGDSGLLGSKQVPIRL